MISQRNNNYPLVESCQILSKLLHLTAIEIWQSVILTKIKKVMCSLHWKQLQKSTVWCWPIEAWGVRYPGIISLGSLSAIFLEFTPSVNFQTWRFAQVERYLTLKRWNHRSNKHLKERWTKNMGVQREHAFLHKADICKCAQVLSLFNELGYE